MSEQNLARPTRLVSGAAGKATARPWRAQREIEQFDDSTLDRPYYAIECAAPGLTGYIGSIDGMRGECQQANAALIVTAVNAHDALVEACKAGQQFIADMCKGHSWPHTESEVWKQIAAALKLAEGN